VGIASASERRARAEESFGSAAQCVGAVEHGMALFALTRGQFSMLDILVHVMSQVGKCSVSVWTWAVAEYEVQCFEAFMQNKQIEAGTMVIDLAGAKRSTSILKDWRAAFGDRSIRVCKNHAKIATVETPEFRVLVRGSMNLNFNPRFEQFDITEGGPDFDLVRKIETGLPVLEEPLTNAKADAASSLGLAFEAKTLQMFEGVKVWAK